MDYLKIYNQLIDHRKMLPKLKLTYYERHHIIPRCLGGDNSPENLIYLTAEDHYVAHLLLAKVHGGSLWTAVKAMGITSDKRKIKNRSTFALSRKKWIENMTGPNNWAYDDTQYTVVNIDTLEEFTGVRKDIEFHIKTSDTGVTQLLSGYLLTTKNYCLKENIENINKKERVVHDFYHLETKKTISGTSNFVADSFNVSRKHLKMLSDERMDLAYGFMLLKNVEFVKYIEVESGFIFTATPQDTCTKYGISSAHYYILKEGSAVSAKGIAIYENYTHHLNTEIVYTIFDSKSSATFITTRKNLIQSGRIDATNFFKISSGKQKTAKGLWIMSKSDGTWH